MANYVKFMRGTIAAYNQLETKEQNTLYFLYSSSPDEEGYLYLGNKLISQPDSTTTGASALTALTDVLISEGLNTEAILVYNPSLSKWESQSFESLTFQGASSTRAGLSGMVPAPLAGQENLFLRGDGTWASVGAGTSVFEIETNTNETHISAINRITASIILASGDIAIVKDFIANGKFQYTAYVRSGSQWIAMDGNYNAENVYFKDNLTFTESVGAIEIPASGSIEIASEGKNLKQVMELIFSKEKDPIITSPSVEININDKKAYEVGIKVTPQYKINFDKGNYEFGPDTGVQVTSYSVTATEYEGAALTTQEGEFDEILIQDNTEYYITASVYHSAGSIPVTNLNNEFVEGQIVATTGQPIVQSSLPITGYRSYFYGMDNTNDTINSNFVRNRLINGGPYDGQKKIEFNASEMRNVKRFIIAIPEASTRSGIISAHITTSMYANVLKEYRALGTNVLVEGADGYMSAPYKIWIYEPASITSSEIHEVILS